LSTGEQFVWGIGGAAVALVPGGFAIYKFRSGKTPLIDQELSNSIFDIIVDEDDQAKEQERKRARGQARARWQKGEQAQAIKEKFEKKMSDRGWEKKRKEAKKENIDTEEEKKEDKGIDTEEGKKGKEGVLDPDDFSNSDDSDDDLPHSDERYLPQIPEDRAFAKEHLEEREKEPYFGRLFGIRDLNHIDLSDYDDYDEVRIVIKGSNHVCADPDYDKVQGVPRYIIDMCPHDKNNCLIEDLQVPPSRESATWEASQILLHKAVVAGEYKYNPFSYPNHLNAPCNSLDGQEGMVARIEREKSKKKGGGFSLCTKLLWYFTKRRLFLKHALKSYPYFDYIFPVKE
jgi:hypothetical protein